MTLLVLVAGILAATVGGAIFAGLIAYLFWKAFTLIRHPELGPTLAVIAAAIALRDRLQSSTVIQMMLLFGILIAALGWMEAANWRATHPRHH
jgi:uncharacterized membrane protein